MSVSVYFTDTDGPKLHATKPASSPDAPRVLLKFLNEGGANVVFKIIPGLGATTLPNALKGHDPKGKLLRLGKDLPHVQSTHDQLANFDKHFKPLFPAEHMVLQELIGLDDGFSSLVNDSLRRIDRLPHRVNDFLPLNQTHGLLVTNMLAYSGDMLLQVKPKWLTQSPNAPKDAKRCRTCALRAQRASRKVQTATDAQENCPLLLISENLADRNQAAASVTDDNELQKFLVNEMQPLLQKLRENQQKLDPDGIVVTASGSAEEIHDLCKAMTLRDCTLFILKRAGSRMEAKLADLDLKQPDKLDRWKKGEEDLINQGWYSNTEAADIWREEAVCALSHSKNK